MAFRKAMNRVGFVDQRCENVFWINYAFNLHKIPPQFSDRVARQKEIDEVPPLLDPIICKDIKTLENAAQ